MFLSMHQCLSVLFIVYRVHVYSFCYLVLPVHQVGLCTAVQGWRPGVHRPLVVHPPESGANLHCGQPPPTRHASQGCAQPMQQQNNAKNKQIQSLYCEQIFRKEFSGHFTENKIPTLLLSSLVGTGFRCWPISSLPACQH